MAHEQRAGIAGRRAFVLVIDACGVGALPDAARYGDEGTNTLAHLAEAVGGLELPSSPRSGSARSCRCVAWRRAADPAIHGRLHPLGPGKDSISGHWELMGVVLEQALPTYPEGFPPELVARLVAAMGHEVICNRPDNGIAAIEEFGAEHLRTGALILYTSQDSVLQLAAHVERVPLSGAVRGVRGGARGDERRARGRASDRAAVHRRGRARSSARRAGATSRWRRPGAAICRSCETRACEVHGVGKIDDLFAGVGVERLAPGRDATRRRLRASTS